MSVIISTGELAVALANTNPPRVLDVRWSLAQPDGRGEYRAGHVPGAVYASLDEELSDKSVPDAGRHPLPSRERLQATARSWGINNGDAVVVYDNGPGLAAARAWWLLRHAGVSDVRILDGGYATWLADARPTEAGDHTPDFGDVELTWGELDVADANEAAELPASGILLDARAAERYRGDVEPVDPVAGHIPGAISAPTTENVTADGRFRPAKELAARFARLGIDGTQPVAVYCGSGVNAAHQIAALAIAGHDSALYPGSWSEWSSAGRPVAVGDAPHSDIRHYQGA